MSEVFFEAITLVNLPFTVLLGLAVLYWLMVAIGALQTDFGAEADLDAHLHAGHDHDGDADGDGWFTQIGHFINIGDVPLMVVASVLALSLWTFSMIANFYFTGHSTLLAMAALVPNVVLSLVVTRYLTMPLKPLFRLLRRDEDDAVAMVGQPCRITTTTASETFGQAEIETKGAPLRINVRTLDGATLTRGARAVVVREDRERDLYFIVEIPQPQLELH